MDVDVVFSPWSRELYSSQLEKMEEMPLTFSLHNQMHLHSLGEVCLLSCFSQAKASLYCCLIILIKQTPYPLQLFQMFIFILLTST